MLRESQRLLLSLRDTAQALRRGLRSDSVPLTFSCASYASCDGGPRGAVFRVYVYLYGELWQFPHKHKANNNRPYTFGT